MAMNSSVKSDSIYRFDSFALLAIIQSRKEFLDLGKKFETLVRSYHKKAIFVLNANLSRAALDPCRFGSFETLFFDQSVSLIG